MGPESERLVDNEVELIAALDEGVLLDKVTVGVITSEVVDAELPVTPALEIAEVGIEGEGIVVVLVDGKVIAAGSSIFSQYEILTFINVSRLPAVAVLSAHELQLVIVSGPVPEVKT